MTALRARRAETPAHSRRRSAALDPAALRALPMAVGMFTVLPLPASRSADDATEPGLGAWALRWLPLLGALLGFVAWALSLVFWRGHGGGAAFLGAVVWIGVLALLTRGMHLDGLADVADGLGSRRPAAEALVIMRQSDIGPFGVAAAVGAVLLQVAAVSTLLGGASRAQGLVLLVVVVVAGRLAALDAARPAVPPARPGGFGAVVAGTASTTVRAVAIAVTLVLGWLLLALTATSLVAALWLPFAVLVGLAAGRLVTWHVVRRLDGITGDVFGAVIEITTTVTLLALTAVVVWGGLL
ncbi:adenosylcobinamide-GDP ribazoletransferase [Pseudofrankia sp. BMG5.37]